SHGCDSRPSSASSCHVTAVEVGNPLNCYPERHRAELRPSSIELSAVDGRMTWSRHSRRIDPIPTSCPACQSSSIGTTAKIPDADNYWRCENCGEVWNASRSQTDWYRGQRWR